MTTTRLSRAGQGWQATVYDNGKYKQSRYFADQKNGGQQAAWRKARAALGGMLHRPPRADADDPILGTRPAPANGKPPLAQQAERAETTLFGKPAIKIGRHTFLNDLPVRPMAWLDGSGTYHIEHGVPLPKLSAKYPFANMAVGDSFMAKVEDRHRIQAASGHYGRRYVCGFTTRKVAGGIRTWRVK